MAVFGMCMIAPPLAGSPSPPRLWSSRSPRLGGLLLTSVFFMASGGAQCRRSKGDCTVTGVWENLGRLIAIAAASTVLAGVPCSFIPSLHTRGYKKCGPKGSSAWRRQLRAWRIQDVTVWILALAYAGFCTNFIVLFFANVARGDMAV